MSIFLTMAFLFVIGSALGWVIELLWRNLIHGHQKWINPGFCTGPYLPIYGFGLCTLYLLASAERYLEWMSPVCGKLTLFLCMAAGMTLIEYLAGLFCLKYLKVRLWDYSECWGNIQGIICPLYSFFWAILGGGYYFAVHPHILNGLEWLSRNLAFSFFIGMFFGVFFVDVFHSAQLVVKLKRFAETHAVVLTYEKIKEHVRKYQEEQKEKYHFFLPFRSGRALSEHLMEIKLSLDAKLKDHAEK